MKTLRQGDLVTALFFGDKWRPAVVTRANPYGDSENITLCPITSTLAGGPLRVRVAPGQSGLDMASEILPYRITTLPAHRVGAHLGRLSNAEMRALDAALRDWLGISLEGG